MSNEKPKNYYSLNLTEGKIFIIFLAIILVFALLIIGGVVLLAGKNKDNQNNGSNLNLNEFTNQYTQEDITQEEFLDTDEFLLTENTNENTEKRDNKENADDNNTENENELETEEKTEDEAAGENQEIINIDDSQVLYSSRQKTEEEKIVHKKPQTAKPQTKTQPKPVTQTKTVYNKKYIVQVGSYTNEKTAEDISLYYKMQGYPTFIAEKSTNGKKYFRLRIGPFKEKSKAKEYLTALKQSKYGKESYISEVYL